MSNPEKTRAADQKDSITERGMARINEMQAVTKKKELRNEDSPR